MEIEVQITEAPVAEKIFPPLAAGTHGAWVEFRGIVRAEENGASIVALEYEAYPEMAEREMRRLLEEISTKHPCLAVKVIHRVGIVPVGETAIYVGVAGRHRAEALAFVGEFMDRLKQDVPIWKRKAVPATTSTQLVSSAALNHPVHKTALSLDEAMREITARCQPLPPVRVALEDAFGRVLRETVCAAEDFPAQDRSTRDGYAVLADDAAEVFHVVDTLHAADWRPRELRPGEAVRVATGAALPCASVRVVMQENVQRDGDRIRITKREPALNLRRRGEDVKAGQALVTAGARLDAGKLALLAAAGCALPSVSPRLRVAHFTTGDEIISPAQTPKPGQVRDCNSVLIRGLLRRWPCDVFQKHLPEDFARAQAEVEKFKVAVNRADLVLISGGASVGERDFTRALLEWLGFGLVFERLNLRPGAPLIFGVDGARAAFGLPGNPLSHFVCFHFAVAAALARFSGETGPKFSRGRLAADLAGADCPRETLWPARRTAAGLHPLAWASSGDVVSLATADALLRVPAGSAAFAAGAELEFLPVAGMLDAQG